MRDDIFYTVDYSVNALTGCYLISTYGKVDGIKKLYVGVNALTGCYLISTNRILNQRTTNLMCQCPHGLLPHFYQCK